MSKRDKTETETTEIKVKAKVEKVEKVETPRANCLCGCGASPRGKKAVFVPGHDARLVSMLMLVSAGRAKPDELSRVRQILNANHPRISGSAKLGPLAEKARMALAS